MKPKLVRSCWVKTVVCVMNPGPMADVAIKNAAPNNADLFFNKDFLIVNIVAQIYLKI